MRRQDLLAVDDVERAKQSDLEHAAFYHGRPGRGGPLAAVVGHLHDALRMRTRALVPFTVGLALLLAGVAGAGGTASTAFNGSIAFASSRDGGYDVYAMRPDASDQRRLTTAAQTDIEPSWSPDGNRIAFTSNRDGNDEIYVMRADGSAQTRLTTNGATDRTPTWSPGGRDLAFTSERDGNADIYVMSEDGSGQRRLTTSALPDANPAWSPDGARIAFQSTRDGNEEVYVMNVDGGGQTRLTTTAAADVSPSWSPDGKTIAFASNRDGNFEIYVMNADGGGRRGSHGTSTSTSTRPGRRTALSSRSRRTATGTTRSTR